MKAPRSGELIALAGAIALIVLSTRPWYTDTRGANVTAWDTLTITLALVLATALMGLAVAVAAVAERSPALPMVTIIWTVPVALVALIAVIVRLFVTPAHTTHVCYGAWGSAISVALVLVGAWQAMRDERTQRYPPPDTPVRALPDLSSPS